MVLAYERAGSGPPLVLLHGVGHRRQAWYAVLDRLTPHRDVIVVDLPGHGESPPPAHDLPIVDALLGPVHALLDDLGVAHPHMAGNSLGGRLALESATAGWAASATGLSPAGFWRNEREPTMARAAFKMMQAAGTRLQRFGPALSRHTAGADDRRPGAGRRCSAAGQWPPDQPACRGNSPLTALPAGMAVTCSYADPGFPRWSAESARQARPTDVPLRAHPR